MPERVTTTCPGCHAEQVVLSNFTWWQCGSCRTYVRNMICPTTRKIVKVHSPKTAAVPYVCPLCNQKHQAMAVGKGGPGGVDQPSGPATMKLHPRVEKLINQSKRGDETARIWLVGASNQTLVAFQDRCIIVKIGFMSGSAFGGKTTSFNYADITGIEVQTGLTTGYLEILTSSFQANADKGYWSSNPDRDPFKVPNCLPFGSKKILQTWLPHVDQLRQLVRESRSGAGTFATRPAVPAPTLSHSLDDLKKLAELRDAGIVTEEEFQTKKRQLLGL